MPEFKELKKRLAERARLALRGYGTFVEGGGQHVEWGELYLYQMGDRFDVMRLNNRGAPGPYRNLIYAEDFDGHELRLSCQHAELVEHYKWCLKVMEGRMVLDDLADV